MALDTRTVEEWGLKLLAAYREGPIDPLSAVLPEATIDDAYAIQTYQIHARLAQGDRVVGHKIGLTSRAMQTMLGVNQPDYGRVMASMIWDAAEPVTARLWQPKVEPELAFILARPLAGDTVGIQDVLDATQYVCPAIEVIDSRIRDWRIGLIDTIADNASSGGVVLGAPVTPEKAGDLAALGVTLWKNGRVEQNGSGAAVLGHPALAVAWLARAVSAFGERLEAGHIILSGSATAAVAVESGDLVRATVEGLGSVSAYFAPAR
ncbi:MAG: fumarylacetoacetate hydrolase family protein [Sulfobacillus sp.]|nr:fumarylacetoacetate hydrolase family protein [Sulfobacillus sp.]